VKGGEEEECLQWSLLLIPSAEFLIPNFSSFFCLSLGKGRFNKRLTAVGK